MTQINYNKLKVGYRVKVKTNLIPETFYGTIKFSYDMKKYMGKIVTVTR